jgi:hypothetical protein
MRLRATIMRLRLFSHHRVAERMLRCRGGGSGMPLPNTDLPPTSNRPSLQTPPHTTTTTMIPIVVKAAHQLTMILPGNQQQNQPWEGPPPPSITGYGWPSGTIQPATVPSMLTVNRRRPTNSTKSTPKEHKRRHCLGFLSTTSQKNQSLICPSLIKLYSERTGTVVPQKRFCHWNWHPGTVTFNLRLCVRL